jgi:hypothetical protein
MKRMTVLAAVYVLILSSPFHAQAPAGWMMRIDRSTSASDPDAPGPVKFMAHGSGFHATNPQAAVFWHPANTATGNYRLRATFTLLKPSGHTNYYGLAFGGSDLEGAAQKYLYFIIAQDGSWLIKRRDGAQAPTVTAKTKSEAVRVPDASGQSTNVLEVRVLADKIEYVVNDTIVATTPKTGLTEETDGLYGIRVNHQLEVQIDDLSVAKM